MIVLSEIEWGPIDAAEKDDDFADKFIEPDEIKVLASEDLCIIPGEKGSGKTAFCKGLEVNHGSDYTGFVKIKLDRIEFSAIVKSLSHLASLTESDSFTYVCNYWQYVLIIKSIDDYFKRYTRNMTLAETRIKNYLIKHGLAESGVTTIMLTLIDKCWGIATDLTNPNKRLKSKFEIMPSNLEPQIIEQIKDFPIFDPEFVEISSEFSDLLAKKKQKILITLDGLDRLNTKSEDKNKRTLQVIFDGLAQAVYDVSISEMFKGKIVVKCLFPYDRYLSLPLRDLDKIADKTMELRWHYESLKTFLVQRASRHPKMIKSKDFKLVWKEIMPEKVENKYYKVDEQTYDYILRHTMYRPRHIQIHLKELSKKYSGKTIDPSMISKSISDSSKQLAKNYIREYEIDHPHMNAFLRKLKGMTNILSYSDFRLIIEDLVELYSPEIDVDTKIDLLYKMSFFGIFEKCDRDDANIEKTNSYKPPRKAGILPYRFSFQYIDPIDEITNELESDDLIAIHPIFFDYCKLTPHPDFIVG